MRFVVTTCAVLGVLAVACIGYAVWLEVAQ